MSNSHNLALTDTTAYLEHSPSSMAPPVATPSSSSSTSSPSSTPALSPFLNGTTTDVHIIYPTASTQYSVTTVRIPPHSTFHPGAHWHEDYVEVLRVVQGRARVKLGGKWKVYDKEDGEILIAKGVVHDFMRADVKEKGDEGDVVLEEYSVPADGAKELFFRHLLAMTSIDKTAFGWKLPVQLFLSFAYTDVYMELIPGPLSWYVTHGVGGIAKRVGPWVGLRPFYEEYTPARLKGIAAKAEGKMEKEE